MHEKYNILISGDNRQIKDLIISLTTFEITELEIYFTQYKDIIEFDMIIEAALDALAYE